MNKHLQLVRDYYGRYGTTQPVYPETAQLSDMDIIMHQAFLMDYGSVTFKAMTSGDLVNILAGLIDLAYAALTPIAYRGDDVDATSITWSHDGSVLSVVKVLCDKISLCSAGETLHYSALYTICEQLTQGFLNADFDKAFQIVHQHLMLLPPFSEQNLHYATGIVRARIPVPSNLNEAFYE